MILSGHLTADRVDRAAAASARIADLDARRRTAELRVDALVEVWRADKARQRQTGWQEMDDAARDAIDALSSLLGAIDLARADQSAPDGTAPGATAPGGSVRATVSGTVEVPRQIDRRAKPWATHHSDRLPSGEVRSRTSR